MKKVLFLTVLLVLFTGLAMAQKATIHEQNLPRGEGQVGALLPAGGCPNGDCLFYGGDGSPSDPNADGLWQNNSSDFGIDGQVWSPFVWTKLGKCGGKCAWNVDNLLANIEMNPFPPTMSSVKWVVGTGVAAGGTPSTITTVCSGNDSSPVVTDTGRLYFGFYEEFAVAANVAGCSLKGKGKTGTQFYQLVQPQTGGGLFQLAYQSNVAAGNPNAIGTAEPVDQSFFYSPAFGFSTFTNTTQLGPFHTFSTAVCGALGK